jgi:hypothetical protein
MTTVMATYLAAFQRRIVLGLTAATSAAATLLASDSEYVASFARNALKASGTGGRSVTRPSSIINEISDTSEPSPKAAEIVLSRTNARLFPTFKIFLVTVMQLV